MIDLTDVQRLIVAPVPRAIVRITFWQAGDATAMRKLLFHQAQDVTTADLPANARGCITTLGVTAEGLRLAGISQRAHEALPDAFTMGMRGAAERLGDVDDSAPKNWHQPFGPVATDIAPGKDLPVDSMIARAPVHVVVLHHVDDPADLPPIPDYAFEAKALEVQWSGQRLPDGKEPFGFRDDITDPVLEGTGRTLTPGNGAWDPAANDWRPVRAGEAVLGQVDESGAIAGHPDAAHLERNGSYLVLRRLEQNVKAFEDACEAWARDLNAHPEVKAGVRPPVDAEWVGAQMVGRHKDGRPVGKGGSYRDNGFRYRGDQRGNAIAPSAHIRRSNPRDDMDFADQVVPRHLVFRRGHPYHDHTGQGLLFMAVGADPRRQFEFVQTQWLQSGDRFALGAERDPITGRRPEPDEPLRADLSSAGAATADGATGEGAGATPDAAASRLEDAAQVSIDRDGRRERRAMGTFVTTRGGEYFLLMSRSALTLLGGDGAMP